MDQESGEQVLVTPDNEALQYSGRIDFTDVFAPLMVYACSYVAVKFTGTVCKVVVENSHAYANNYLGYFVDGKQGKIKILQEGRVCLSLAEGLEDQEHSLLLFKRQDACHIFTFYGFVFSQGVKLSRVAEKPLRRIEVYGDSISAGEVTEAVEYVGKEDPEHQGEFSNSWYSYAWMCARKLEAEIHDIAQGGIALLDKTGWFRGPDYIGLESTYDKLQYNPEVGAVTPWDFKRYIPHVVVVAIGQNDSHPVDYMAADYNTRQSENWRRGYKKFVQKLRAIYPLAVIILTTTILRHDLSWDKSIEQVTGELADSNIHHFIYSQNSIGTYGHIRIPEADRMSDELAAFITSLGPEIWKE